MKTDVNMHPLHWDMFRKTKSYKEDRKNLTGNVRIVAYYNSNLIFEDRYPVAISRKSTEADFNNKVDELYKDFLYALDTIKRLNRGKYKDIDKDDILSKEDIRDMVFKTNYEFRTRWINIFPFDRNWHSDSDNSGGNNSVKLIVYQKEFDNRGLKLLDIYLDKSDSFESLKKKVETVFNRWEAELPSDFDKVMNPSSFKF